MLLRILRYLGSSDRRCNVLSSVAYLRRAVYVVLTDGVMFCPPLHTYIIYVTLFTLSSQTSDRVSEGTDAPNRIFVKKVGISFPQFFCCCCCCFSSFCVCCCSLLHIFSD